MENLVMLCAVHHRLVHHSGWEIQMSGGRPEFVPPGWIDPLRRPRRQPDPTRAARTPVPVGRDGPDDMATGAEVPAPREAGPPDVGPVVGPDGIEYALPSVRVVDTGGPC